LRVEKYVSNVSAVNRSDGGLDSDMLLGVELLGVKPFGAIALAVDYEGVLTVDLAVGPVT